MPQSQIFTKKAQIFVTPESTVDTYETQAAADGFIGEIEDNPLQLDSPNYEPNEHRGDFAEMDENPGPASATIAFRCRLKGASVQGQAPEFRNALLGCGARESIESNVVTYYPWSIFGGATDVGPPATEDPSQSYSVTILEDGVAYAIKGAFGNFTISGSVGGGEPGFLNFSFMGAYVAVAGDALETVTYDPVSPPAFVGATADINVGGAASAKGINSFEFDAGNQITLGRDINETSGIYGSRIVRKKATGSIDPEMVRPGTYDYFAKWRAGTAGSFTTGAIGSTAGNIYTFTVNRLVMRAPTLQNRDGIRAVQLPFGCSADWDDVEGTNNVWELAFS